MGELHSGCIAQPRLAAPGAVLAIQHYGEASLYEVAGPVVQPFCAFGRSYCQIAPP